MSGLTSDFTAYESIPKKQDGLPIPSNKPAIPSHTSVWELVYEDSATQWGFSSDADAKQWGFSSVKEAHDVQESLLAHNDWNSWECTYDDDDANW